MVMLMQKDKIVYPDLSYKVNGILFSVRKQLGQYANEKQYADAVEQKLKEEHITYEREKILDPSFAGELKGRNKVDFLIDGKIVLELKAESFITKEDYYQVRRYLNALNLKLGIVVNMRRHVVNPKRILNSKIEK